MLTTWAQTPSLSSDEPIKFDDNKQEIVARGNALLHYQGINIIADQIRYQKDKNIISASKDLNINHKQVRVVADEGFFNLNDKSITAQNVKAGQVPYYIQSESVSGNTSDLIFNKATIYYGEPSIASPNTKTRATHLRPGKEVQVQGAILRIGKVPFFYIPSYTHSLKESLLRLTLEVGHQNQYGFFTRNQIMFKQAPGFRWGALVDYYARRGVLAGPAFQYNISNKEDSSAKGVFLSGFISDYGNRGLDNRNKPIAKRRRFVQWQNQHTYKKNLKLTTNINYWSDSKVLQDFRPKLFNKNQYPDNYIEGVYSGLNYYLSAFTRFRPNNFLTVQQRLPEVRFDLLPSRIFNSFLFHRLNVSYAYLDEKSAASGAHRNNSKVDFFYGIQAPIEVTDYFSFTPLIGVRAINYFPTHNSAGHLMDLRAQFGFDAQFNAYSQSDYKNKFWDIHGLRHLLRPVLQYRCIPRRSRGHGMPASIDTDFPAATNLPIIDLGYLRNVDNRKRYHLFRFGFENSIQTRSSKYGSRDLVFLNLYQDFHIRRYAGEHKLSDFYTIFGISPAYWLTVDTYARFAFTNKTLQELRNRITIREGNLWKLQFITDNLNHRTDQYFILYEFRVTAKTRLKARWRYNARLESWTEQAYGIATRLGHAWNAEFEITRRTHSESSNGLKFKVFFSLVDF